MFDPYKSRFVRLSTVVLFLLLSVAGLAFSVYLFVVASNLYTFLLAIFLLCLSLISGFFNIFASFLYYRSHFYYDYIDNLTKSLKPLRKLPSVAVAVPLYNEELSTVKKNLLRLKQLDYPKDKVKFYILDDSTKAESAEGLKKFAAQNGMVYLHRDNRKGFKAGALNNMLKHCKEEFLAIFDSDEYLTDTNFLKDLLPYFQDSKIGYIQTEKTNEGGSFFSDSVNLFDAFFFKFIQPARALDNTAIFSGSCGVIRINVLREIGGFPEYVIEDTFFSLESDLHGYKGLHIPKIYAYGQPVKTFSALIKQQWRYNYGDTQFISYFLKRRSDNKRKDKSTLSTIDWISHGYGLNYLSVMLIIFTIASVLIVFSNLPFVHLTIAQAFQLRNGSLDLELFGAFAFVLSFFVPVLLTKIYFGSVKKGLMVFFLNFSLAIVRTKAAIAAVFNTSAGWNQSRSGKMANRYDFVYTIRNTSTEILFSAGLFVFAYLAVATHNISGGIWLAGYGILYLAATIMIYLYG